MNTTSLNPMLEQLAVDNPQFKMMMDYMQQQEQQDQQENDQELKREKHRSLKLLNFLKKEKQKNNELLLEINELFEENDSMDFLLEKLAQTLGACEDCWGLDTECQTCQGEGQPGFYAPQKDLLKALIYPILKKHPWTKEVLSPTKISN